MRYLMLRYSLAGEKDWCAVDALLSQYGLHTRFSEPLWRIADGRLPSVLSRMNSKDIERHLAQRIADASPGTFVDRMAAIFVRDGSSVEKARVLEALVSAGDPADGTEQPCRAGAVLFESFAQDEEEALLEASAAVAGGTPTLANVRASSS